MKPCVFGIVGGLILGLSLGQLYEGIGLGMLSCPTRHSSEMCEWNYWRTGIAEATTALGLALAARALWLARRRLRGSRETDDHLSIDCRF